MPETKVAIRLGTDGKAQVQNDFREVERSGVGAMNQIAQASENAGRAGETAATRQIEAWKRQAAAAAGAAQAQARNAQFNNVLGVRDFDSRGSDARRRELEQAFAIEERGLNRTQRVIAQSSVLNFAQQVASGTPVLRAFAQQSQDVATVLAADEGGIAGGLAKARGAITPFRLALIGTTAALAVGAGAFLSYNSAVADLDRLGAGSARTLGLAGGQLNEIAVAAADASRLTTGAAREILTGYVQAGGIGRDVLQGLIGLTEDFAAATGREAKDAVADLAAAFANPAKGAEELARRYGLLDQAQVAQIRTLVESNDRTGAQKLLLEQLQPLLDGSAEKLGVAAGAWSFLTDRIDGAWQALGRFLNSVVDPSIEDQVSRLQLGRRVADAVGGDVGFFDRRIAALRQQGASEKQAREEQAKSAQANQDSQRKADESARGAVQRGRERESEARRIAAEAKRNRETELRDRQQFIRRIGETLADEERQQEEQRTRLLQRLAGEQASGARRIAGLRDAAEFAGNDSPAARLELARRAALRDAAADPDLNSRQIADRVSLAVAEEQAQIDGQRADLLAQINSDQAQFTDLLSLANQLARVGIDLASEEGQAIRRKVQEQARVNAGAAELNRIGAQSLDTLFNPDNWRNWGDLGRSVINQLGRELITLAALNPLKNALFGSALPTLFGGVLPGFATGTPWFSGGAALVGENGPERVVLPRGSRIDNASATRRILTQSASGAGQSNYFDLRGAVTTQQLLDQMNSIGQQAAVRGAAGGATMARADMARRQRRRII
jgi:hypothetical protein